MQVSTPNDVKIYTIATSTRSAIPDWLAFKKKKALRGDINWQQRVELIQDFQFPEASMRLKASRDGNYLLATGVYKPRIRVFELAQMSLKFERHTLCENVQFEILSDDWRKTVYLQADRSVEFHSSNGMHYRTRIPKFGRDMKYHYPTCDLLFGAAGPEVYRLNLEQGRFLNSLETMSPGINVCSINPAHQMWGFGGEDCHVEFWDPRQRQRLSRMNVGASIAAKFGANAFDSFPEVSSLEFRSDGLTYAVGTSTGQVVLYDLRSTKPLLIKDHQYEFPIKAIRFHEASGNVISADSKIIKVWNKDSGDIYTSMEPEMDVNDLLTFDNSGLIMTANEGPGMNIFYVPSLGPAPKWCSFLDNLTEELEESKQQSTYDDYRFVTRKELAALGLEHLIGTNLLKAYMHGYFIDLRLYEKAKAIANPFAYDEYRERLVREKLEKQRESRISAVNKLPKINRSAANRLLHQQQQKKSGAAVAAGERSAQNPLGDSRFADMFQDPDFEVDEQDPEYVKFHTQSKQQKKKALDLAGRFERVVEGASEEEDSEWEGRGSDDGSSDEDGMQLQRRREGNDSDDSGDELLSRKVRKQQHFGSRRSLSDKKSSDTRGNAGDRKKLNFYEVKGHQKLDAVLKGSSGGGRGGRGGSSRTQSFGDRLKRTSRK